MSLVLLERGAAALGPIVDDVTFVGGASVTLWITDPAAPAPRPDQGPESNVSTSVSTCEGMIREGLP